MKSVKMRKKIMIVDDEPDVSFTVEFSLKGEDFDFISAENGEKCLELLENSDDKPDLILLDMMMPGLTGEETFHELQKINPNIRVVVTSGYEEHDTIGHFVENELTGFIQKPYTAEDLINTMRAAIFTNDS